MGGVSSHLRRRVQSSSGETYPSSSSEAPPAYEPPPSYEWAVGMEDGGEEVDFSGIAGEGEINSPGPTRRRRVTNDRLWRGRVRPPPFDFSSLRGGATSPSAPLPSSPPPPPRQSHAPTPRRGMSRPDTPPPASIPAHFPRPRRPLDQSDAGLIMSVAARETRMALLSHTATSMGEEIEEREVK